MDIFRPFVGSSFIIVQWMEIPRKCSVEHRMNIQYIIHNWREENERGYLVVFDWFMNILIGFKYGSSKFHFDSLINSEMKKRCVQKRRMKVIVGFPVIMIKNPSTHFNYSLWFFISQQFRSRLLNGNKWTLSYLTHSLNPDESLQIIRLISIET